MLGRSRIAAAALAACLVSAAALAGPAPAAAQVSEFSVKGAPAAGPARYDRTFVTAYGPRKAKRVLLLVPGTIGGRGNFSLMARDIVRRVPNLQVWAWDRRSQAFEDTFGFRGGDPDRAFRYYLGGQSVGGRRFQPVSAGDVPFVGRWGMGVQLADLRRVVQRARAGGRKVILGGHSLGGSTALAYATWDFGGRPGWRDLAGLVLIDGGVFGFDVSRSAADADLRRIAGGARFLDQLGVGAPWAPGVFSEVAALYARKRPDDRSPLRDYPLLSEGLRPPVPVTNEGLLGYVVDEDSAPATSPGLEVRAGSLATAGDPRPWRDGENSPIQRVARVLAHEPGNSAEWYFPERLWLDFRALSRFRPTPANRRLGLRLRHARRMDLPVYLFQSDLTGGRLIRETRAFIRSTSSRVRLVSQTRFAHLDPLTAKPESNGFLKTVVPFLDRRR